MQNLTQKIADLLTRYMRDPAVTVNADTVLVEIGIEALDIPMILLDVEDAFDVRIGFDAELDEPLSVAGLLAVVQAGIDAKNAPKVRSAPRKKSNWMSTSA